MCGTGSQRAVKRRSRSHDTNAVWLRRLKVRRHPIHFIVGRHESNSGQTAFVTDIRTHRLPRRARATVGVGAVIDRWELGFGGRGLANRIDWSSLERTMYTLESLTSGDGDFIESASMAIADTRIALPVDYRGNVAYSTDAWTAAAEVGHGLGGGSFHGGYEQRFGSIEVRGGARYTVKKWNPAGGVGFDLGPRVSLDLAVFGTNTNIERKRQAAFAASIRFNRIP